MKAYFPTKPSSASIPRRMRTRTGNPMVYTGRVKFKIIEEKPTKKIATPAGAKEPAGTFAGMALNVAVIAATITVAVVEVEGEVEEADITIAHWMMWARKVDHHKDIMRLWHMKIFHRYRSNIRPPSSWYNSNSRTISSTSSRCRGRETVVVVEGNRAMEVVTYSSTTDSLVLALECWEPRLSASRLTALYSCPHQQLPEVWIW